MTTTLSEGATLTSIKDELCKKIEAATISNHSTTVTVDIPACDPLTWLEAQSYGSKIFWATPDALTEIAGVGVADLVTAAHPQDLKSFQTFLAEEAPNDAWYFGGIRFDGGKTPSDPQWEALNGASFVRPRFLLHRKGERTSITCHLMESDDRKVIKEQVESLTFPEIRLSDERIPEVTNRQFTPDQAEWEQRVKTILSQIESKEIEKQVLARKIDLRLANTLTPYQLLRKMREKAPRCFSFMISSEPSLAFVGTTPELLYTREGEEVRCEAVAGTRPMGSSEAENDRLARELLNSEKERREHQFVSSYVQEVVEELSTEVSSDVEPSVLRRGPWQHLYTQFEATLQPGVTDLSLIQALAPTPAVAGVDVEKIRLVEQFDRGWYAAPVGWLSRGSAEFAVAIRSALVAEKHVTFFAGAGIVEGSDGVAEWEETETKMNPFLSIFDQ